MLSKVEKVDRLLKSNGEDGTYNDMERVAKLEAYMEHAFADMADIKAEARATNSKLDSIVDKMATINERLARLPTKDNLIAYTLTGLAIALSIVGLVIGGLSWIQHH